MEGKPSIEVSISDLPVQHTATEANVNFIVYLKRNSSATGELTRMPNGTATERARRELYSAGEIRAEHERILESLSDVPTYELDYCDLSQGISSLELLLRDR
jgi:hypothetical protein